MTGLGAGWTEYPGVLDDWPPGPPGQTGQAERDRGRRQGQTGQAERDRGRRQEQTEADGDWPADSGPWDSVPWVRRAFGRQPARGTSGRTAP